MGKEPLRYTNVPRLISEAPRSTNTRYNTRSTAREVTDAVSVEWHLPNMGLKMRFTNAHKEPAFRELINSVRFGSRDGKNAALTKPVLKLGDAITRPPTAMSEPQNVVALCVQGPVWYRLRARPS